jgi:hypothetical protein
MSYQVVRSRKRCPLGQSLRIKFVENWLLPDKVESASEVVRGKTERGIMEEELLQTAVNRAYSSLELSTYELLEKSETLLAKISPGWYIGIFTPQVNVYRQLVEQVEPLTRALTNVMGSFSLGICTQDDPIPPGGSDRGTITDRFFIDPTWYYLVSNESHPYWCEVAPEHLLKPLP